SATSTTARNSGSSRLGLPYALRKQGFPPSGTTRAPHCPTRRWGSAPRAAALSAVAMGRAAAVEDLQEISRGIHPAILSKGGLGPALQTLAHRSVIPVELAITTDLRVAEQVGRAGHLLPA